MILPTKTQSLSNSLLGMAAQVLNCLNSRHSISSLWEKTKKIKAINSFDKFLLSLDLLFALGLIDYEDGGTGLIKKNA